MDNAFIMGCWFVLAAIIAVFVICALLDRRQFKKLGLPLAFPPIQTDKARIDHIRLDGWSGGMMELRYRVHNDSRSHSIALSGVERLAMARLCRLADSMVRLASCSGVNWLP